MIKTIVETAKIMGQIIKIIALACYNTALIISLLIMALVIMGLMVNYLRHSMGTTSQAREARRMIRNARRRMIATRKMIVI